MFGHSTGALIASYFVSRYMCEETNKIIGFSIDRLCMDSPLTDMFIESPFQTKIAKYMIKFICLFSDKVDLNYGLFQPGLVPLINNLIKEFPELEKYEVDTKYQKEMFDSPFYSGFGKFIIDSYNYIENNKINIEVRMVCSKNHSEDRLLVDNYFADNFIIPENAIKDLESFVSKPDNLKYKQYISGHGCLMKPLKVFVSDGYNYKDVADFLFGL